ncbi:S8 family serine peptidase [bacterium]|nr:S8 family serine peptidase [bacterium]
MKRISIYLVAILVLSAGCTENIPNNAPIKQDYGINKISVQSIDNKAKIPGCITVWFKDELKIRQNKDMISFIGDKSSVINEIISSYSLVSMRSPGDKLNELEGEREKQEVRASNPGSHYHNPKSVYMLEFSEDVDTREIANKLWASNLVDEIGFPSRGITHASPPYAAPPTDPGFATSYRAASGSTYTSYPGNDIVYFPFNREAVFEGWNYYQYWVGSRPRAEVAVVDFSKFSACIDNINWDIPLARHFYWSTDWIGNKVLSTDGNWTSSVGPTHGTLVSSTLAADKNNGVGFCGVNPGVTVLPLAPDNDTRLWGEAIKYAANNGIKVIVMSQGLLNGMPAENDPYVRDCIAYANSKGSTTVISAGNSKLYVPYSSSNYSGAIMVAALDDYTGQDASYTNWGTNYGTRIDVSACGNNIPTSEGKLSTIVNPDGSMYDAPVWGGTSAAAPIVAGLVSYLYGIYPQLTYMNVRALLVASANVGPSASGKCLGLDMWDTTKNSTGNGSRMVDFLQAMQMLAWSSYSNYTGYAARAYNAMDFIIAKPRDGGWWTNNILQADTYGEKVGGGNPLSTRIVDFASYWGTGTGRNFGGSVVGWSGSNLNWNYYSSGFVERKNPDGSQLWGQAPADFNQNSYKYFSLGY